MNDSNIINLKTTITKARSALKRAFDSQIEDASYDYDAIREELIADGFSWVDIYYNDEDQTRKSFPTKVSAVTHLLNEGYIPHDVSSDASIQHFYHETSPSIKAVMVQNDGKTETPFLGFR